MSDEVRWRGARSLAELLLFAAGKEIDREFNNYDPGARTLSERTLSEGAAGVLFTDGTGVAVVVDTGFAGSDVTPPDPADVAWYIKDGA